MIEIFLIRFLLIILTIVVVFSLALDLLNMECKYSDNLPLSKWECTMEDVRTNECTQYGVKK